MNTRTLKRLKDSLPAYILMLPALLLFALFTIFPIIWAVRYCLYDYDGSSVALYVGFDNFEKLFTEDKYYWLSWGRTLLYASLKTLIEIPLALVCAALINSRIKGAAFFRTLFYMPQILPGMVMFVLFVIMLNPFNGILNMWMSNAGIIPAGYSIFAKTPSAFLTGILVDVWHAFGINMLFLLAGLASIPKDIYESADIDGASRMETFFYITVPMLGRMLQIIVLLSVVACLRTVGSYFILTEGGPDHGTELTFLYIYNLFFPKGSGATAVYGYGAAVSVVSAVIIGFIAWGYSKASKKLQYD